MGVKEMSWKFEEMKTEGTILVIDEEGKLVTKKISQKGDVPTPLEIKYLSKGTLLEYNKSNKPNTFVVTAIVGKTNEVVKKIPIVKLDENLNEGQRFNYPFNFVKNDFNKSIRGSIKKGINSGEISFTLINTSPLLIPKKDENEVKIPITNDNEDHIIPASSFKGLIKNNFETITNSCFSILEDREENKTLSYRKIFTKDVTKEDDFHLNKIEVIPARVIKKEEGKFYIEKLKSAWIKDEALLPYERYELDKTRTQPKKATKKMVVENFKWKEDLIINIVDTPPDSTRIAGKLRKECEGYVKDTGLNFTGAHHQRFFYYENINDIKTLEVCKVVEEKYNKVLTKQQTRNSRTKYWYKKLREGALVWAIVQKEDNENNISEKVLALSYVETPKFAYYNDVADLLGELKHCDDLNNLCYACRVFGTVIKDNKQNENVALKGKLEFNDLLHRGEVNISDEMRMDILDSPEPSNAAFYIDKDHYSYDQLGATIRGRKFYWNHLDKQGIKTTSDLKKSKIINNNAPEKQAPLVKMLLSGNYFEGKVSFRDLSDEELGALILSFGSDDSYFKLGAGKPLGMGSIQIKNLKLSLSSKEKYSSFSSGILKEADKDKFINNFKMTMKKEFEDKMEYNEIPFIKEFEFITKNGINFSVENYPKGNFPDTLKWFMNMKNTYKKDFKLPTIQDYK